MNIKPLQKPSLMLSAGLPQGFPKACQMPLVGFSVLAFAKDVQKPCPNQPSPSPVGEIISIHI